SSILSFGLIALLVIGYHLPDGFSGTVAAIMKDPRNAGALPATRPITLLTRQRIPWQVFLSFMLIPLSSIMFPHMSIMCFTARRVTAFRKTVVLYPLCIMAIWLPCVFLGALAFSQPKVTEGMAAGSEALREWLAARGEAAPGNVVTAELTTVLKKSKDPAAAALWKQVAGGGPGGQRLSPPEFVKRLAATKDPALKPF